MYDLYCSEMFEIFMSCVVYIIVYLTLFNPAVCFAVTIATVFGE